MTLTQIIVLALLSFPFMGWLKAPNRSWGLLIGSVLAVAWFMAGDGAFSHVDLFLLGATIALVIVVWQVIRPAPTPDDQRALWLFAALMALIGGLFVIENDIAPQGMLVGGLSLAVAVMALPRIEAESRRMTWLLIALMILVLVVVKTPFVAAFTGEALAWDGTASPLVWLGFSYIAFRLIAVLLDSNAGRLPEDGYSLRDFAVYALFFPVFTAGPIDHAPRFIRELQAAKTLDSARIAEGIGRIAIGAFKKFVIADSLALISLSPSLVEQTQDTLGLWLLLYVYAFQIFFDFSGYSDVAIGLGRLYGLTLPENFDRPYLQRNLQQFWQRWHITLSTWFRVYFFTPLSRAMIRSRVKFAQWMIVLVVQLSTMILIGLWHGMTLNFFLWGLWHGVGLYGHKWLADHSKGWTKRLQARIWSRRLLYGVSVLATFHFVALGWVFFALPNPQDSVQMLARLFGMGV